MSKFIYNKRLDIHIHRVPDYDSRRVISQRLRALGLSTLSIQTRKIRDFAGEATELLELKNGSH